MKNDIKPGFKTYHLCATLCSFKRLKSTRRKYTPPYATDAKKHSASRQSWNWRKVDTTNVLFEMYDPAGKLWVRSRQSTVKPPPPQLDTVFFKEGRKILQTARLENRKLQMTVENEVGGCALNRARGLCRGGGRIRLRWLRGRWHRRRVDF